jgi:RNA polymerase sigma factor (sigma-70 family)
MTTITLDTLCEQAQAGDRAALEALVKGLQDPLYRLALRFLSFPEAARDATQEILILVITQLSTFRRESSVSTWAYRVATRHLLRQRKRTKRYSFERLEEELGQPESVLDSGDARNAEQRLLEEEIFLGCTQAMLRALDRSLRIAFVLGAILELEASEGAAVLEISEVAFRKRLSRARSTLDGFVAKHCSVANPQARCRCAWQIGYAMNKGRLDPKQLRFARPVPTTSLEALRAHGELKQVRRSLELYRAQPQHQAPEDFARRLREMLGATTALTAS